MVLSLYLVFYKFELATLATLDLFALPIGIYLLALPDIQRRVGREVNASPLHAAGLAVMLGTGLLTLIQVGWESWHSFLMLIESVAAFLYGLSRRVKVFFLFGCASTAAWIGYLLYSVGQGWDSGWLITASVFAIVVGGGITTWASLSERKRADLVQSVRERVNAFKAWQ